MKFISLPDTHQYLTFWYGKHPRYTPATPTTASSIVRYLWEE